MLRRSLTVALPWLAVLGCSGPPDTPVASAPVGTDIDGRWRFSTLSGVSIDWKGAEITLDTRASQYSASLGCNNLGGPMRIENGGIRFTAGVMTGMGCPPPIDQLEQRLRVLFDGHRNVRREGQMMYLSDDRGEVLAVFFRD